MEKQHLPWKKLALSAMFLALAALCVFLALKLTARKDSVIKYGDFFDHAAEIDVLFLGSSHVINGVNPVELYEQYGYTSYNMGGHGSTLPATYWELMMALDYCTPQVVVIDTYMLEKDYQYVDVMYEHSSDAERASSVSQLHLNMDAFPLNATKKAAITDLISDASLRRQFYYPALLYHTRWSELTEDDYAAVTGGNVRNPLLGCELRYDVETKETPPPRLGEGAGMEKPTVGVTYLNRMIEECTLRGIEVLLTCLPLYGTPEDERAAAGARLIAAHYGVPYAGYYEDAFPAIDLHADFNDHGHLNVTGAEKVTATLGMLLQSYYGADYGTRRQLLADHRGDPAYAFWQDRVDAYAEERARMRINQPNLYAQLNLINRDDVSSIVFVRFYSDAMKDAGVSHLIENLRSNSLTSVARGKAQLTGLIGGDESYLLVRDASSMLMMESVGTTVLSMVRTGLGTLTYAPQDIYCALTSDAAPEENLLNMEEHYDADVQIIIYDDSGEILSHRCYYMNPVSYRSEAAR